MLLLPILGSALQVRYDIPYVVKEKVNDRDYIVATPEPKWRSCLCHVNMLKLELERDSVPPSPLKEVGKNLLSLSSAEPIDEVSGAVALSSADLMAEQVASAESGTELVEDVASLPSAAIRGRLKNSEMLLKPGERFTHLSDSQSET